MISSEALFAILRFALGTQQYGDAEQLCTLSMDEWQAIYELAGKQNVLAIAYDGLNNFIQNAPIPGLSSKNADEDCWSDFVMDWCGNVFYQEQLYHSYAQSVSDLAAFYNQHGLQMMILKGWGCSLLWPTPNHRPMGDIDIWLFGKQSLGDELIREKLHINPKKSSHHTIFFIGEHEVENHITLFENDCHDSSTSEAIIRGHIDNEKPIKACIGNGIEILLPSPNTNAYFLMRHMSGHFATESINLRHVLDWATFIKQYSTEIDWPQFQDECEKVNMHIFSDCINDICISELGLPKALFPMRGKCPHIRERVLADILSPEFQKKAPPLNNHFFHYCFVKARRNLACRWKYKITFRENFWRIFIRFCINRIKHPRLQNLKK